MYGVFCVKAHFMKQNAIRLCLQASATSGSGQMSGIAALAAAAAATQKINTTIAAGSTMSMAAAAGAGIKVVSPTIVTPSGIKVTPVASRLGMNHPTLTLLYWNRVSTYCRVNSGKSSFKKKKNPYIIFIVQKNLIYYLE